MPLMILGIWVLTGLFAGCIFKDDLQSGSIPNTGGGASSPSELIGYWIKEKRMDGANEVSGDYVDGGRWRLAYDGVNGHYIWNEVTGSDFQTEFTYTVNGDMITYEARKKTASGAAWGFSCAHLHCRCATAWPRLTPRLEIDDTPQDLPPAAGA